ncbi:MAG: RluA family pseudouridine synthase [Desulfobacterales bacterium]|nr:RluA family pseudouridine synthase [Desulfobacterales bacterium]
MKNQVDHIASPARVTGEIVPGRHCFPVTTSAAGQRLDQYLAVRLPAASRTMIAELIRSGRVSLNARLKTKASYRVRPGDEIDIVIPLPVPVRLEPEPVAFELLFEDDHLLVLSKPPRVVVHPAAGHHGGTLVHGLLFHCRTLSGISGVQRPGIVHRLDKDTSGVMVVAKDDRTHQGLVRLFKERRVNKVYHALVDGRPDGQQGRVDLPIGRHPVHRKKMAVRPETGRRAATRWKVLDRFAPGPTFLEITLETGRTHQIRVHMAAMGCPVAGDLVYGRPRSYYQDLEIGRQCLHASILSFDHPLTGESLHFQAPIWPDMATLLARLRESG